MYSLDKEILVRLEINEPWNAHQILLGKILRPLKTLEGEEYYIFQMEEDGWLIISARYINDSIEDIYQGQRIQVNIAKIKDATVFDADYLKVNQVDHIGIGAIEKER